MTDPPKKSPSGVWAAKSVTAQRQIIAFAVLALIVVAFFIYALVSRGSDSNTTTPSGLTKTTCTALFNARVGHDPHDNAFWHDLVECANNGLLPPGQNDPGFYAP